MKLWEQAVRRPIFTTMIVLIVIVLGVLALTRLPVDLMPDITSPTINISTSYGDASPEEMEELVTHPIEEAVSAVPGVQEISSTSSEGSSSVQVTFNWGTNLDTAASDLRDRLDRVISVLPDDAGRPVLRKFDLSATPILTLGVTSQLPPLELRKLVDSQVQYRLERVSGVAAVDLRGGLTREIHVDLDPAKVQALQLPLDQIASRIKTANSNLPAGSVYSGNYDVTVRTPGEFKSLDDLRNTVVCERNGAAVTLGEVAKVADASTKITRFVRINGAPGLQLTINKQSGANTVAVAREALREVEQINRDIPAIRLTSLMDSSVYIRQSINNVAHSAVIGGILAIFILLVFLRNLKSTAIISTAIPVSIIATFGLIYFCGFTLNLMTLGGLALGVGMLLDNSIVVLENIFRLRENGRSKIQAAIDGAQEVAAPIIASTLTTLVVFLPLIFVRGMSGIMFKQLSFVVGFSMFCSLITALTLAPMLSSRFLTVGDPDRSQGALGGLFRATGRFFARLESGYKGLLHWALDHRTTVIAATLAMLMVSLALFPLIGTELMPATDEGEVRVDLEMETGTKLDVTAQKMNQAEKMIMKTVPELKNLIATTGGSGWGSSTPNTGQFRISLVPLSERKRSGNEVCDALRKTLGNMPGTKLRVRTSTNLMIFRQLTAGAGSIELDIRGHDYAVGGRLAKQVQEAISDIPGIVDVNISRSTGAPEQLVMIDRAKAERMGLTVQKVADQLETVLSGDHVSQYREQENEYDIVLGVDDSANLSLADLLRLTVINSVGTPIALGAVASIQSSVGPSQIERSNQERCIEVTANISGRSQSKILADIREKLKDVPVPGDFSVDFGGDYEEQQKSFRDLLLGFVLSLVLVYMVMACQYESLRDPLVVMFSVPLAVIGVVLMLVTTSTTFNIQSYIGCIMLGGIVVNNAILLVDTTNLLRRRDGYQVRLAIEEAGRRRLRPILMTALTTILGLIPMAIGAGEGGEAQAPLARAVVGGMLSSTLITLLVIPVVYSIFEERLGKREDMEQAKMETTP
jgi:hydrophobic/amphiphilic exporter-1 (mainly G- bacteria), HAE1 family